MTRGKQEDAAEFLQHLLESIEIEMLSRPEFADLTTVTPVAGIFDGWLRTTG